MFITIYTSMNETLFIDSVKVAAVIPGESYRLDFDSRGVMCPGCNVVFSDGAKLYIQENHGYVMDQIDTSCRGYKKNIELLEESKRRG